MRLYLSGCFLLCSSLPIFANEGVSYSAYRLNYPAGPVTIGYSFHVDSGITVNALGAFTDPQKGSATLNESHEVGLWDSSGDLLASVTVSNGDALIGMNKYHSVAPLSLSVGDYVVAAYFADGADAWSYGDSFTADYTDFTVDPGISSVLGEYVDGGFAEPSKRNHLYYGAANILTQQAVPEPASLSVLGFGAAAIGLRRRRRR